MRILYDPRTKAYISVFSASRRKAVRCLQREVARVGVELVDGSPSVVGVGVGDSSCVLLLPAQPALAASVIRSASAAAFMMGSIGEERRRTGYG